MGWIGEDQGAQDWIGVRSARTLRERGLLGGQSPGLPGDREEAVLLLIPPPHGCSVHLGQRSSNRPALLPPLRWFLGRPTLLTRACARFSLGGVCRCRQAAAAGGRVRRGGRLRQDLRGVRRGVPAAEWGAAARERGRSLLTACAAAVVSTRGRGLRCRFPRRDPPSAERGAWPRAGGARAFLRHDLRKHFRGNTNFLSVNNSRMEGHRFFTQTCWVPGACFGKGDIGRNCFVVPGRLRTRCGGARCASGGGGRRRPGLPSSEAQAWLEISLLSSLSPGVAVSKQFSM